MKATLTIQFQGTIRQEDVDLPGTTAGALMEAARRYLDPLNAGLPYEKRHHLLAVKPSTPLAVALPRSSRTLG